jgi:hypothetical protein
VGGAPAAPAAAIFRKPRRDVTSIARTPSKPAPEKSGRIQRFYRPRSAAASR